MGYNPREGQETVENSRKHMEILSVDTMSRQVNSL